MQKWEQKGENEQCIYAGPDGVLERWLILAAARAFLRRKQQNMESHCVCLNNNCNHLGSVLRCGDLPEA